MTYSGSGSAADSALIAILESASHSRDVSGSGHYIRVGFDASRSNSIYGNSATVQPATYYINIWKRIE